MAKDQLSEKIEHLRQRVDRQQSEAERAQFSLAQQIDRLHTRTKIGVYRDDVIADIIKNHTNQIIGMWFKKNLWVMLVAIFTVIASIFTPFGMMMYYKSNLDTAAVDIAELKAVRIEHTKTIERIRANLKTDIATLTTIVNSTQSQSDRDKSEILSQIRQINDRINNLDLVIRRGGDER